MASVRELVEQNVRASVRGRAVDVTAPGALDRLIAGAIADYEADSVRLGTAPVDDVEALARSVHASVAGYGVLQPLFDDPEVEEIWINEPTKVFVSRGGRAELTNVLLTDGEVEDLVERMLRVSGRRLDRSTPFVDASLAGGERLHVVIPDITRTHWAVNIRKYLVKARGLDELVRAGTLTSEAADFLATSVRAGLNILVSGATGAGKTTLLRALLGSSLATDRIVTCEEVFELCLEGRDVVALQTRPPSIEGRGEVTLRMLVRETLRMRPDRLVIGEVRGAEALDLLIALNAGVPGACTIHANSARDAISKLATLPLLAGTNVSSSFVTPTVAASVDLVVHMDRTSRGRRQVAEILGVSGRIEAGRIEAAPIFIRENGTLRRHIGELPRPEKFARAGISPGALRSSSAGASHLRGASSGLVNTARESGRALKGGGQWDS